MIKINLIPKEYLEKIDKAMLVAKISFISFLVAAIFAMGSIWQFTRAKALEIEFSGKNLEYQKLQEDVKKTEAIKAQISEINNYISAIDKITKNRFVYVAFMQDTVNNLPPTMWFTGIQTTSSGETLSVTLNLFSNSLYDMAWWVYFLENNQRYTDVAIGMISASENGETTVFSAPLTLKYSYK